MFKKMRVITQIGLGFGVLILILLVISVVSFIGLKTAQDGFNEYRDLARHTNLAGRLQANMLMVELAVEEFLTSRDDQHVQEYTERVEKVHEFLEESKQAIQDPERAQKITLIADSVGAYETAFTQVVEFMKTRDVLVYNTLDPHGLAMREALTEIIETTYNDQDPDAVYYASRIEEHVLLARLYATKFLDTNAQEAVARFREEIGVKIDPLVETLDSSLENARRRTLFAEFLEARKTYQATFEELVSLIEQRNTLIQDELDRIGPVIAQAAEDVKLSVKADQDTLGPAVKAHNEKTGRLVIIVSILSILVGLVLSVVISTMVTRPLGGEPREMATIAQRIFRGDLTVAFQSVKNETSLYAAMKNMVERLKNVIQELDHLIKAVQDGRLDARGNADVFSGGWRDLVVGMNNVIDAFMTPFNVTAEYVDRIAKGDVPNKITDDYKGDFNEIKNNLNLMIENLSSVLEETQELILAVQEGRLDARGNASAFAGDWRELVVGVNNVIDAFMAPFNVTAEYLDRVAKGDVPEKITEEYQGDFNEMKDNLNLLIDAMHEVTQLAEEMAEGDLTVTVNERSAQDRLMQVLNTMVQRLSQIVLDVKGAASNVANGSQAMSSSSQQMSQGTTEQAAAAEQASSSMEEMVANIRQNSDNALQTEKIAVKAAADAREGGTAVAQTVAAMQDIVKRISIIEEIARQTHMLSLNATIEAAKAQEYGKGFGVVASEVRALAERAQTAAVEINRVASDSIAVAEKAGEMLKKLVPDIQKTAELVQEISAASKEQNTGAGQINRAIQQLDNVIQQNAATSEEMAATAEELASQAEMLQNTITFFRVDEREQVFAPRQSKSALNIKTQIAHLKRAEPAQGNSGNGKEPGGHPLHIEPDEPGNDHLDEEFERY